MQPAYPTTEDLSIAVWLKRFAAVLPAYAAKYQIAEAEAHALQRAEEGFLNGMSEQITRVMQAILRLAGPAGGSWPPSAVPYPPLMRALPRQATMLSYRILSHSAYDPADGCALGLESPIY
ncbi:hypothetical protein E4631_03685 [Hymenobacter sp. UV11]|uniref:hypothetical protein n=1 Tax=Hymenobacter sp. UV11 TaxID=1849735 RepID=UPI00105DF0E4|nr:hypothetical protein [Hymenobacter sp. UV11]TDN36073.1 hypothetical protein A8B98_11800 [Hymenobacter sp. UV11]TFZ68101.1 hypothetical protein E4631_03685 [Hymenobacter sp. UV11]